METKSYSSIFQQFPQEKNVTQIWNILTKNGLTKDM